MKTLIIALCLLASAWTWKAPAYQNVRNSYGCSGASLFVLNDTVYVDTTCAGVWKKKLADTSQAVGVAWAGSVTFGYSLYSDSADTDSIIYQEEVLCKMVGLDWMPAISWKAWDRIDSVIGPKYSVSSYGQREVNFSTCDSVKFVAKVLALTAHGDTIFINKRVLRLRETE